MRRWRWLSLTMAIGVVGPAGAEEAGRRVAERSQAAHFSYGTLRAVGEMTLRRGEERRGQRSFVLALIEEPAPEAHDQALITITAPSSLSDTRLLSWSTGTGDDQQWLATPRTRRVRRIADRGRHAAFVGSDFSYEDILKWQIDDYDYVRVGDRPCGVGICTVVEALPRARDSNYESLTVYYDDQARVHRIDYFDEHRDAPWKTLIHREYGRYGESWQPAWSVMTDHRRETSTEVAWSGYVVDAEIDERLLSPRSLER